MQSIHDSSFILLQFNTVWINADIFKGPGGEKVVPVDANRFFGALKKAEHLSSATLSLGWTTSYGDDLKYTKKHVDEMVKFLENQKIQTTKHFITFPVRAVYAIESKDILQDLLMRVSANNTNKVTLTLWTGTDDKLDMNKLKEFIATFTVHSVYVDLPSDIKNQLNLDEPSPGASTIAKFSLINLVTLIFAVFIRNGFF